MLHRLSSARSNPSSQSHRRSAKSDTNDKNSIYCRFDTVSEHNFYFMCSWHRNIGSTTVKAVTHKTHTARDNLYRGQSGNERVGEKNVINLYSSVSGMVGSITVFPLLLSCYDAVLTDADGIDVI